MYRALLDYKTTDYQAGETSLVPGLPQLQSPPENNFSVVSQTEAVRWIRECEENHEACNAWQKASDSGHTPRRLILVGADSVRLVDTTDKCVLFLIPVVHEQIESSNKQKERFPTTESS